MQKRFTLKLGWPGDAQAVRARVIIEVKRGNKQDNSTQQVKNHQNKGYKQRG